ncbi:ABC transporter ATP-binding protein [uncultured Desulfovibrio sp.]|uniref:energy-coupling factor ABC transporter ATP-binding protein n=1 Tax=uncultured Desulfovibrio sp. TaxID=167968 RepID=UPI00260C5647|nr:ABC transporter ATP-binding protein [uncultured Desulfovibrio sp.]
MSLPEQPGASIFSLEEVDVTYIGSRGPRPVLRGVSFALTAGQQVGLYGPNGSGKTTLFRCITGLVRPCKGQVRFHGKTLRDEKDFHALRCKVGFVLQHAEDQLFFPSVLEDVAFGPLNLGLPPEQAREQALATLRRLGLDGFEQRLTHRLSGGEKKLVALATVLAMEPEALLLDEPTNDLDQDARQRLIDILRALPTARMVISHDWDFLSAVCGEYRTIREGRLLPCAPDVRHSHEHVHPLGGEPHWHLS